MLTVFVAIRQKIRLCGSCHGFPAQGLRDLLAGERESSWYNELKLKQLSSECSFNYPLTVSGSWGEDERGRKGIR